VSSQGRCAPTEFIARLDELFERCHPSKTTESTALVDHIVAWRAQNRAVAASFVVIGELFTYRLARCSGTEEAVSAD